MSADRAFARTWTGMWTGTWTWTWLRPTRLAGLPFIGFVVGVALALVGI